MRSTLHDKASLLPTHPITHNIDGLVQDFGNSSALELELPQSATNPSIFSVSIIFHTKL